MLTFRFKFQTALWVALAVLPLLAVSINAPAATSATPQPVGLMVKFKPDVRVPEVRRERSTLVTGNAAVDRLIATHGVTGFEPLHSNREVPGSETHPLHNVYVLRSNPQTSYEKMKTALEVSPYIEFVELDYPVELLSPPNDPLLSEQWVLNNTGQSFRFVDKGSNLSKCTDDFQGITSGTPGADIGAGPVYQNPPDATTQVIVAIIDTGVDIDHIDLAENIWINPAEIPANGIDDDHNGLTDDTHGWFFAANSIAPMGDTNDPTDGGGHGTHVAGIIGAVSDNGIGIAGVCPNVRIMALRFFATTSNAIRAVYYAADNGADVINMSWRLFGFSQLLEDAFKYAHDERSVILVVGSGNDGFRTNSFPASSAYTISVGATDQHDHVTSFSTIAPTLDLVAPGENILSLRADETDLAAAANCPDLIHVIDDHYYLMDGTSMASPQVAGVAAYLRSVSPGLVPERVRAILHQSATDLVDPYGTGENLPGWDEISGYGRVDLGAALALLPDIKATISSPGPHAFVQGIFAVTGIAGGGAFRNYVLRIGQGYAPTSWEVTQFHRLPVNTEDTLGSFNTAGLAPGPYTIELTVGPDHVSRVLVFVATGGVSTITEPLNRQEFGLEAVVRGSAFGHPFDSSSVEYLYLDDPLSSWVHITSSTLPAVDTILATMAVDTLAAGNYRIRLNTFLGGSPSPARNVVDIVVLPHMEMTWSVDLNDGAPGTNVPGFTANLADLDGDGVSEILIGNNLGIRIYNADGTRDLNPKLPSPTGSFSFPITVGNLNGDAIDDFVSVDFSTLRLHQWHSNGGSFTEIVTDLSGPLSGIKDAYSGKENDMPYIILADADNDGLDDIFIHKSDHEFPLVTSSGFYLGTFITEELLVADLDGDGQNEIYTHTFSGLRHLATFHPLAQTLASYATGLNGEQFDCLGISAVDIDGDETSELILFGRYNTQGYYLYAFEEGLSLMQGWPQALGVVSSLALSVPVFVDLDQDNELEYVTTYFDQDETFIRAWNLDGMPMSTPLPTPGMVVRLGNATIDFLIMTDVSGDGRVDIVASVHGAVLNLTNPRQRLFAWDGGGALLPGFPIAVSEPVPLQDRIETRMTPLVGDLNRNGKLDIVLPTLAGGLSFKEFSDVSFDPCKSPVTSWRYNRSWDAAGLSSVSACADYICGDVDASGVVDAADVDYLVNYLFINFDPPPIPLESGNVDCSPGIDMADLTWLISYVYIDGPDPCDCLDRRIPIRAELANMPSVSTAYENGYTTISLVSGVELKAIDLELSGSYEENSSRALQDGMELFDYSTSDRFHVALLDRSGRSRITPGTHEILRIKGHVEIESARGVDADNRIAELSLGAAQDEGVLPKTYALYQNYPNPFNPATQIQLDLPQASRWKVSIYNILGQSVKVFSGYSQAGTVTVNWDASKHASGVYLYRAQANEFTATKKMVLMK